MVGQSIGGFEILREIGRGGMGVVYEARQASPRRHVALKVLPPELAHVPQVAARFADEANRMAMLEGHPNIAAVYAAGEADGVPYFAMRLLSGADLESRLAADRRLPLDEAAEIAAQVAEALDYAHRRGIVHRDIKPANIMFDDEGRPLVTDFGIAKAADEYRLTQTGTTIGTPEYASPEQIRGDDLDGRSDLYSLGVVLYRMVCGQLPFTAPTPMAHAIKHINEAPPPPGVIVQGVPPPLEHVILRCLAKRPEDRFASGKDLAAALRSLRLPHTKCGSAPAPAQTVVVAEPASAVPVHRRGRAGGPALVGLALLGAIALIVGTVMVLRTARSGTSPDSAEGSLQTAVNVGQATGTSQVPLSPQRWPVKWAVGYSVRGRVITAFRFGDGPDITCVLGAFHGDEPGGHAVCMELVRQLEADPAAYSGRTVVIVPACNPDGLDARTRANANGVDINRNWSVGWAKAGSGELSHGSAPMSEPEVQAIAALLAKYPPHKVINLHQAKRMLNPTGADGIALAREMAKYNGLRANADIGYATPGSFGDYCGRKLGLAMVTYELPGGANPWSGAKGSLLAAIRFKLPPRKT
ncbi:DUF2817 domain-containing protein [bacterium]|nr:DUF2817 domain-containing protein [bacterium]